MTLKKTKTVDQITVAEDGTVFYRIAQRILENDKLISESYVRHTVLAGQSIDELPVNVQVVCNAIWATSI